MAENDGVNNAEAFDEELLVEEGDDDTDVSTIFPPDHYEGVFDPAVTEAGDARVETIQARVIRDEIDDAALDVTLASDPLEGETIGSSTVG
jgi:hypothetical protein